MYHSRNFTGVKVSFSDTGLFTYISSLILPGVQLPFLSVYVICCVMCCCVRCLIGGEGESGLLSFGF